MIFMVVDTGETFWRLMVVEQQSWAEEAVQGNDTLYLDQVASINCRASGSTAAAISRNWRNKFRTKQVVNDE